MQQGLLVEAAHLACDAVKGQWCCWRHATGWCD
jgi:hypothetical protein